MSYITRKVYGLEKQILYNNCNTNNLYGTIQQPDTLAKIAGYRRILEGSIWTDKGILKRANIISDYTAGEATVIVDNPYPFAVGDVLYEIGDSTENSLAEANAVNNATAQEFGTITAIDAAGNYQVTEITPSAIAIGDVFVLDIEGQIASFTATTTDVSDVTAGLKSALTEGLQSHFSITDCLDITEDGTKLSLKAKESGEVFSVSGTVTGTGQLAIAVTTAVGALTITPNAGNNDRSVGAKIGTIDQLPLGIIAHQYYLTDDDGLDKTADFAAYDTGNIAKKALPYLDGQIVRAIPTLKYFPLYGY